MTGERTGGTNVPKYFVAKRILERGIVKVHLDPRLEGVYVPSHFKEDPVLLLQFAYGFQLPSFQVDEEAISGVLNFNGLRFHCVVPWEAVFALTAPEFGHEGQFWPEDVPRELLEEIEAAADEDPDDFDEPTRPAFLSVVPDVTHTGTEETFDPSEALTKPELAPISEGEEGVSVEEDEPTRPSARPFLRIVKDD